MKNLKAYLVGPNHKIINGRGPSKINLDKTGTNQKLLIGQVFVRVGRIELHICLGLLVFLFIGKLHAQFNSCLNNMNFNKNVTSL